MERLNLHMQKRVVPSIITFQVKDRYDPTVDLCASTRPGANDALRLPSRIGNKLFYRDKSIGEVK